MTFSAGNNVAASELNGMVAVSPVGWLTLQQATMNIPTSSDTSITWTSVHTYKGVTPSDYWLVGNPSRITIPATGTYSFFVPLAWAAVNSGLRVAYLYRNGTTKIWQQNKVVDGTGPIHGQVLEWRGPLTSGDYYEVRAWQNTGSTLSISNVPLYLTVIRHS
jgi:hypothetical protein